MAQGKKAKQSQDLSSPSQGSNQQVVIGSPTSSTSSSDSNTIAVIYGEPSTPNTPQPPPPPPPRYLGKRPKIPTNSLDAAGNGSKGSTALASSMIHLETNPLDVSTGKRAREADEPDWFKQHIFDSYQSMFGESLEVSSLEEATAMLFNTANLPYADNTEFKNRMAALELLFRKEVDTPIPDATGIKDIKSKGYSLLLANSFIISQVCKKLRSAESLDISMILQGLEFIQNISELNMINIKIGTKNGFEAAEEFSRSYKSGGSLDQITSKQQEKSVKLAEKSKTHETLEKVGKWVSTGNRNQSFRRPIRYEPRYQYQSQNPVNNNNHYNGNNNNNYRRFNQTPNTSGSSSNSSNNNSNSNNK